MIYALNRAIQSIDTGAALQPTSDLIPLHILLLVTRVSDPDPGKNLHAEIRILGVSGGGGWG